MPSTSSPSTGPAHRNLLTRVAWSTALSVTAGALLVAVLGGALAWPLALQQEDRRLHDSLHVFASLLAQTPTTAEALDVFTSENAEAALVGVRLSMFRRGQRLGGTTLDDHSIGCQVISGDTDLRRCALRAGDDLLVAESSLDSLYRWRTQSALALLAATFFVALLAAWISRALARRAIEPLQRLRRSVAQIDPENPSIEVVATPLDWIEVEDLRREFVALLVRLGATLDQARQFAFNAAHEWRTPLATLRAEVELLREEAPQNASLARIERHTLELIDRLERVLILATPSPSRRGEPVSLETTAREVIASLSPAEAARLHLSSDEEGLVLGDAALLRMLVRNAIVNALKFSQHDVQLRLSRTDEEITLLVEDQGMGIAPADRAQIFRPFFRGQSARQAAISGTGLGLALIAHIARLHHGHASFDDVPRGATFRLQLPAWRAR